MSREDILNNIKKNEPVLTELPVIMYKDFKEEKNLKELFIVNVEAIGGKSIIVEDKNDAALRIKDLFGEPDNLISLSEGINISTINLAEISSAKELDQLELAILDAQFGVAENGAVWVSGKNIIHRVIPFITLHLVLILNEEQIIENMHDAYEKLSSFDEGYGVFISGPSKTADIEQSLVIGAQGPLSTTIFLIKSK
ncbi:MAG: LUD domain-containing protein [Ignavibacteriaceae bacterium]